MRLTLNIVKCLQTGRGGRGWGGSGWGAKGRFFHTLNRKAAIVCSWKHTEGHSVLVVSPNGTNMMPVKSDPVPYVAL